MTDLPEQVRDLITEALAEEGGGMVTGYYLIAGFIDADGDHGWLYATPEDQQMATTMGLLQWGQGCAQYEQHKYLEEIEGDDD